MHYAYPYPHQQVGMYRNDQRIFFPRPWGWGFRPWGFGFGFPFFGFGAPFFPFFPPFFI